MASLLLAATLAPTLVAQETAALAAGGIVSLSFNSAVLQTAEAQRELGALQTKYAPRQAQLKSLNDEVAALQQQLQATGDKLSDVERANREQTLANKEKQLQRDSEDFKTDSQSDSQQVMAGVAQKVFAFLQTYAKQHGYSMIVERGSDANPVVWYVTDNMDITDALIKAYNAQSGVTAPAPAAPRPNASGELRQARRSHRRNRSSLPAGQSGRKMAARFRLKSERCLSPHDFLWILRSLPPCSISPLRASRYACAGPCLRCTSVSRLADASGGRVGGCASAGL